MTTRQVTKRTENRIKEQDEKGLSLVDRKLLQEIAVTGSWQEAAESLDMTPRQVRNKFKNPAFKEAYDALFDTEDLKTTQRELEMVSSDVARLYEEAKNAEMVKKETVVCPSCNHKFTVFIQVMNWAAKLKAGETLLKVAGILKDTKNVKVEGTVANVHMSTEEYLALRRIQMGLSVPEHMYQRLLSSVPDLPPNPAQESFLEGEFRNADGNSQ